MSQQINLYKLDNNKFPIDFTFQYAFILFAIFGAALLVITTVDMVRHMNIKKEFSILDKEQQKKVEKLQNIAGKIPQEQDREQIVAEIKLYESEKKSKQEILALLETAQSSKIPGFSGYLESLAKEAVPGLWFTRFNFKDNGNSLSFYGRTLKPEFVPQLISGLSSESLFRGKMFQSFRISMDEKTGELSFVLETRASEQP